MAQCTASIYWWQPGPLHPNILMNPVRLLLHREESIQQQQQLSVLNFRDDDAHNNGAWERDVASLNLRLQKSGVKFSPWASKMFDGYGITRKSGDVRESTDGPSGGGNDNDDDGGDDGGDDDSESHVFFLPLLTLALAAFHLGYCISVWIRDDEADYEFLQSGFALFCLLVLAAIRLNGKWDNLCFHRRTGIDAYILGLGSSVGVMVWAGERCITKRETNPAGIVALCAASISVMFTAALYHNI